VYRSPVARTIAGPRCPRCQSADVERLPYPERIAPRPLYVCDACEHVWRESDPVQTPQRQA
jgi:Zn ribbon nucleic-acid-binding protein